MRSDIRRKFILDDISILLYCVRDRGGERVSEQKTSKNFPIIWDKGLVNESKLIRRRMTSSMNPTPCLYLRCAKRIAESRSFAFSNTCFHQTER